MPLPVPNLDDRRFQQILDEARRLIPKYCPEWTDHNLSDPGITLLELFAWMTESLLYRVNQVPDKNYIKFLEMIGLTLEPPRSARVPLTFYLSAPQANEITIVEGTEAATVRTETAPATIFSSESDLIIRPAVVAAMYTHRASLGDQGWAPHDLNRLGLPDQTLVLFPNPPSSYDAFYLGFKSNHGNHVMAIALGCRTAGGTGIDPKNPPIVWEVWQGPVARWVACEVESEGTAGFNVDGEIVLHLGSMVELEIQDLRAFWLRCRLTEGQNSEFKYDVSPEVERYFRVESRGGTVTARHSITVKDEHVGVSDGSPGQVFKLLNGPLLSRNPKTDYLVVELPNGSREDWKEVADFAESGADDHCYTVDGLDGTITFGPSLLQPDGSIAHFGAVPPKDSALRFARYRYGGGIVGNVARGTISVLKSAIPYVARVQNREPAIGGLNAQTLDDAKLKAARHLRSSARAVTAEDFEFHTLQIPGVARARCLAPGAQPGDSAAIRPGLIFMIVLPQAGSAERPEPDEMVLSDDMRRTILDYLTARCVLGIGVEVRVPEITWVSINAELLIPEHSHPQMLVEVRQRAEERLYQYLNPYQGGPKQGGWPFGRDLHLAEIYALLQSISGVDYVADVKMYTSDPGQTTPSGTAALPRVRIGKHGIIASVRHAVTVSQVKKVGHSG